MAVDVEGEEKQIPRQSPRLSAERVVRATFRPTISRLSPSLFSPCVRAHAVPAPGVQGQAVQKAIEALLGPTTHKADDAAGGKDSGGGGGGDPYTLQPVNWRK